MLVGCVEILSDPPKVSDSGHVEILERRRSQEDPGVQHTGRGAEAMLAMLAVPDIWTGHGSGRGVTRRSERSPSAHDAGFAGWCSESAWSR